MKFANPAPLGLYGFATTTWLLSMLNAGWFPIVKDLPLMMATAFAFGGVAQFVAGVLEYPRGNTFGFVAFTSCLIPQLQDLILNEIRVPQGRILPQLFLFDIQDEQLDGVQSLLKAKPENKSTVIRLWQAVNEQSFFPFQHVDLLKSKL